MYQSIKLGLTLALCLFAAALNAEKLFIGLDADLSGSSKKGGLAIMRGAQIAIDEINAKGGIKGKELSMIVRDHRGNPARGQRNLKELSKQDNLIAVIGGAHTPVVLQELELIHKNKILFLVPWAAGTPITENEYSPNYVFRASIRDMDAGPVLVRHASQNGATKLSLVLERTGWGRSNEVSMKRAAKDQIVGTHWVNWGTKDLSKEVEAIKSEGPDAIMLVTNAPEGAALIKAMLADESVIDTPVISHWGIASGDFVSQVGLTNLSKMTLSTIQTFSFLNAHNTKLAERFLTSYKEKYHPDANQKNIPGVVGLAQAYDLVHMLAIASENARSLTMPDLREAFESIKHYDGLIKQYRSPFSDGLNEALTPLDYFIAEFDEQGDIVPWQQ